MAWFDIVPLDHAAVPESIVSSECFLWYSGRELTSNRQSKASNVSWFALAVATLGKEAVEGRDGFTVMVLPREPSEPKQTEESQESQDSKRTNGSDGRMTLCWELMGASVTEP
jgi:hypothetical protein